MRGQRGARGGAVTAAGRATRMPRGAAGPGARRGRRSDGLRRVRVAGAPSRVPSDSDMRSRSLVTRICGLRRVLRVRGRHCGQCGSGSAGGAPPSSRLPASVTRNKSHTRSRPLPGESVDRAPPPARWWRVRAGGAALAGRHSSGPGLSLVEPGSAVCWLRSRWSGLGTAAAAQATASSGRTPARPGRP